MRLAGVSGSAGHAPALNGMRHTGKWMTNSLSVSGTWKPTSGESATCSRMYDEVSTFSSPWPPAACSPDAAAASCAGA